VSVRDVAERLQARRRARRSAWVLLLVVACVYGGVIVWHIAAGGA
jgi:hypothetical protein